MDIQFVFGMVFGVLVVLVSGLICSAFDYDLPSNSELSKSDLIDSIKALERTIEEQREIIRYLGTKKVD